MRKSRLVCILLFLVVALSCSCAVQHHATHDDIAKRVMPPRAQQSFKGINPANVTIMRDKWGVPHIYGKTDAEAIYGMTYAHAEDDFGGMQEAMLGVRRRLAEIKGPEGAAFDMLMYIINADSLVAAQYDTVFSPEFKEILAAAAQAINDYAMANPEEVLIPEIFPIVEQDFVKGYLFAQTALSNSVFGLLRIMDGKLGDYKAPAGTGSNGMLFSKNKTKEGQTVLVSNTHQPVEGPLSWYEAHINSEDGLNMLGGTFIIGVSIFLGSNENLAWTHTTNYGDFHDIYRLKMHPTKKNTYYFDGQWLPLTVRKAKIKVKIGPFALPISRTYYWSKYGPTLKNKSGYFALRYPAMFKIGSPEEWFRLNKAKNFEEFKQILDMQQLPSQNILYADKEDNIYYLYNTLLPYRNPAYNWLKTVRGDTSATLWPPVFYPIDSLPQHLNPQCGYLFNSNNSSFNATHSHENYCIGNFCYPGLDTEETNRSIRFTELMRQFDKLSYDDIKRVKYDRHFSDSTFYTRTIENLDDIMRLDPAKYPDIAPGLDILKRWDKSTTPDNKQATLVAVAVSHVLEYISHQNTIDLCNTIPEKEFVEAIRFAQKHLKKHFGQLEVPLGEVLVHARSNVELPLGGMPENLAPTICKKYKDGKFTVDVGDTYILFVRYTPEGKVLLESVVPYGTSNRPDSPHFTDQMSLYAGQKLKPMTLDKAEIMKNAVRIYKPGQK